MYNLSQIYKLFGEFMSKRRGLFAIGAIFSAMNVSCISMSSLQTAEVLPVDAGTIEAGVGFYTSPSINKAIEDASKESTSTSTTQTVSEEGSKGISIPYFEFGYRRGLAKNFEMGIRYTFPGALSLDGKYSLLNREDLDVAIGLGVGYQSYETKNSSGSNSSNTGSGSSTTATKAETKAKSTMIDVTIPVYTSYRFTENFALYASPKMILRNASSSSTTDGKTEKSSSQFKMAGFTFGTMIGGVTGAKALALEITYAKDTTSEFDVMQFGGAMLY
jgi:hypothetical protein